MVRNPNGMNDCRARLQRGGLLARWGNQLSGRRPGEILLRQALYFLRDEFGNDRPRHQQQQRYFRLRYRRHGHSVLRVAGRTRRRRAVIVLMRIGSLDGHKHQR
jgi:hypothetical protein